MGLPLGRAITGRHDDAIGITEVDGVGEEFKDIFPGDEFHAVGTVVEGVDSEDGSSRDGPEGLRLDFVWESWGCYPAKHFDNCVVLLCCCAVVFIAVRYVLCAPVGGAMWRELVSGVKERKWAMRRVVVLKYYFFPPS